MVMLCLMATKMLLSKIMPIAGISYVEYTRDRIMGMMANSQYMAVTAQILLYCIWVFSCT